MKEDPLKKETIGIILFCLGLLLFALATSDLPSTIALILGSILHRDLHDAFLSSFVVRAIMIVIGGISLYCGLQLFVKKKK